MSYVEPMSYVEDFIKERNAKRKLFPPGEWDNEPERTEWKSEAGFPCISLRAGSAGALCGYVGVPPGHPWHGKSYEDLESSTIQVHGGVTYASPCQGEVCHVAAPGEPDDVWWLGFDCAHAFDYCPGFADSGRKRLDCEVYRNLAYVKAECESLAAQAKEAALP
jgi:hypothetical protein